MSADSDSEGQVVLGQEWYQRRYILRRARADDDCGDPAFIEEEVSSQLAEVWRLSSCVADVRVFREEFI